MSNILIQEIIDIIDGVTNAHSGDLNSTVYLQEMRDAILQVSGLKPGSMNEVIYLQQIRNAIQGVADGQFGNLPARVYLQEIRDAYNGITARKEGVLDEGVYWDEIKAVATPAAAPFTLPYTFNAALQPNGALPSPWVGATFLVSGGVIVNTPEVGANLLTDPGLETAYVAGLCGTLTKSGSPTVAESADVHGGAKAQQFTAVANANRLNYPTVAGVAGAWYRFSQWVKRTAGSGTGTRIRANQTSLLPGPSAIMEAPINVASYTKRQVSFISITTNNIFAFPCYEVDAASFDTVIVDDGTLERLTYSSLFSMLNEQVGRLVSAKIKPNTLADGTISFVVHWADATASPNTYLIAWISARADGSNSLLGLLKCVNGTYSQLIAPAAVAPVAGAWLEIRPVDNDTVALFYNDVQRGANVDVVDVPGNYCGFGITGGNAVQSFFVG